MIELLKRLSEIVPGMCQKDEGFYIIGAYSFQEHSVYGFLAYARDNLKYSFPKSVGPDLLQCTLQKVIEARGWDWRIEKSQTIYMANIYPQGQPYSIGNTLKDNPTEALLTAFIEVLEHESKNQRIEPED